MTSRTEPASTVRNDLEIPRLVTMATAAKLLGIGCQNVGMLAQRVGVVIVIVTGVVVAGLYFVVAWLWLLFVGVFVLGVGVSWLLQVRRREPIEREDRRAIRTLWTLTRRIPEGRLIVDPVTG